MKHKSELQKLLFSLNKKSYPAYKSLQGDYNFDDFELSICHVQGDPFASPSDLDIFIAHKTAGFPAELFSSAHRKTALEDYLLRLFSAALERFSFKAKGSGKSGLLSTTKPGQEILKRTACEITEKGIHIRLEAGFPANGRTVNSGELEKMLFEFIPACVRQTLFYKKLNADAIWESIYLSDDQQYIREHLEAYKLCAFVANDSILPRQSGISQRPMKESVPFTAPVSLEVEFSLPHKGKIRGLGIPKGITLIVGGGYHGKSTLLNALELGVYNHIKGDGREYVITDTSALKLRAEDGRCVKNVNISMFINDLPNRKDTHAFSTEDASGSTSQAANVVEGIEAGSKLLLIDEDTSATNFMVRDEFMQQVIKRDKEPITPFLERALDLYEQSGISTILVAGSSGSYFHIADTIIQMDCYHPIDITDAVKKLCSSYPMPSVHAPNYRIPEFKRNPMSGKSHGRPFKTSGHSRNFGERTFVKVKTLGINGFQIDKNTVELRYLEQLTDAGQTTALGYMMKYILEHPQMQSMTLTEMVSHLEMLLKTKGLEAFCGKYPFCGLTLPRRNEIFACINRYRL